MRIAGTTLTGPDALTISRVPLACALVALGAHRGAALGVFIAGVVTDILDGWWARRRGTTSDRVASLIVTRLRLRTWAIMHTDLNRASGAALAVVAAVGISRGQLSLTALLTVAAITQLAVAEELAIAGTTRLYDPNDHGLLRETIARSIRWYKWA